MASTEVERHTGVDVEDVPSAEWGWSTTSSRGFRAGAILAGLFLLAMTHGNHQGHVEDIFLIAFAVALFFAAGRSFWRGRHRDTA